MAITGDPTTPIADAADALVALDFADERSVVQTRFATTVLALLRASLGEDLAAVGRDAEQRARPCPSSRYLAATQVSFLGMGWTVGLAHEAALKMREAAQAWTEAYPAPGVSPRPRERRGAGPAHVVVRRATRRGSAGLSAPPAPRSCATRTSTPWPRSSWPSGPPWAWPSSVASTPTGPAPLPGRSSWRERRVILTVTLNAALDVTYEVDALRPGREPPGADGPRAGRRQGHQRRTGAARSWVTTWPVSGLVGRRHRRTIAADLGGAGIAGCRPALAAESRRTVSVVSAAIG